jgi:hypothetical protein
MSKVILFVVVMAAVAAVVIVLRRRGRAAGALGHQPLGADADSLGTRVGTLPVEGEIVGIADVDPVPLAQTSGEGIDLDANKAAHAVHRDSPPR